MGINSRFIDGLSVAKGAREAGWLFGEPVLRAGGVSTVGWCKENSLSQWQKGGGWTANLYGGVNTGDDWAGVFIPVNELPITQFTTAQWSYYMTGAETAGVNIVVWIHDPTAFEKRAEVTQVGGSVAKAAGWNSQDFTTATTGMFYYGEGTTGSGLTAGTQYAWSQFQADTIFSTWTIYRISLEYGWEASGTLDDAWLAEVSLNGMYIPLHPQAGARAGGETKTVYLATVSDSTDDVAIITPAAAKRVVVHSVFMNTASATAAQFEVYFGVVATIATAGATPVCACVLDTDTQAFETAQFGSDGPRGAIGEALSIRTSANITTNGNFTIVYHEE
jgi:hypothetical protein